MKPKFVNITSKQAYKLIKDNKKNKKFVILDIRRESEYLEGHFENAVVIDNHQNDFEEKLNDLDKSNIYFIYCRTGRRTGIAMELMKELEFKCVYNLEKGKNDWLDQGYALVV